MKVVFKEAKTYIVHMMCECGGEFVREQEDLDIALTSYPPKFLHVCNKCGKREYLDGCYPKTATKEIEE